MSRKFPFFQVSEFSRLFEFRNQVSVGAGNVLTGEKAFVAKATQALKEAEGHPFPRNVDLVLGPHLLWKAEPTKGEMLQAIMTKFKPSAPGALFTRFSALELTLWTDHPEEVKQRMAVWDEILGTFLFCCTWRVSFVDSVMYVVLLGIV
jgi:hypothetical protein